MARELTDAQGNTYRYTVALRRGMLYSAVVGFLSSFLGIGGGVIHVPLMVGALGLPVHLATATSHRQGSWAGPRWGPGSPAMSAPWRSDGSS